MILKHTVQISENITADSHLSVWPAELILSRCDAKLKWSLGLLESATDMARGRCFDKHGKIWNWSNVRDGFIGQRMTRLMPVSQVLISIQCTAAFGRTLYVLADCGLREGAGYMEGYYKFVLLDVFLQVWRWLLLKLGDTMKSESPVH